MKATDRLRKLGVGILSGALLFSLSFVTNARHAAAQGQPGAVYSMTNDAAGNAVAVFNRADDGTLTPAGTVPTGGLGSGSGLGSQGSVVLSKNNRWLFVVNAGSNDISVFSARDGLTLADRVPSGGIHPISLTVYKDWLYVLNDGDAGNITGFSIGKQGRLTAIPGSTRPLSNNGVGAAPGPAQVSFNPSGELLIVTEKATNLIDAYHVDEDGVAGLPVVHPSSGVTPFGFAFDKRGTLVVSEAFGGAAGQSAASSYEVSSENDVEVISASVPTLQTSACWLVVTKNGKFAYTANTTSNTITGYRLKRDGTLTLLNADGVTAQAGDGPNDAELSKDGRYLYTNNGRSDSISVHHVEPDGSLWPVQTVTGLAATSLGMAAR